VNLADRIVAYLAEHPWAHCDEIARGLRTRTEGVRMVLKTDARITDRKGSPRGREYALVTAQERSGRIAGSNRASRLYRVLRDRKAHTRREIFDREGFLLTNNAAAELRADLEADGLGVVFDCKADSYQIISLDGEVEEGGNDATSSPVADGMDSGPPSSTSSQLGPAEAERESDWSGGRGKGWPASGHAVGGAEPSMCVTSSPPEFAHKSVLATSGDAAPAGTAQLDLGLEAA
jgi:hypothetical protein